MVFDGSTAASSTCSLMIFPDLSMRNVARLADSIGIPWMSNFWATHIGVLPDSPIAEHRKADSVLLSKCKVRKGTVHSHAQDLGVGTLPAW